CAGQPLRRSGAMAAADRGGHACRRRQHSAGLLQSGPDRDRHSGAGEARARAGEHRAEAMSARFALRALGILALLALALASSAVAQPAANRQTTPGGLSFRYVHMPEDTHQALGFAWRDGSSIALPGKEALSAPAPALMMEGPKGLSRSAMIEDLRDLQASIALSASVNFVQGNVLAPAAKFSQAAEMMARVLSDPSL